MKPKHKYDSGYYRIWSHEHAAWWKPNRMGYTENTDEAGIYTRNEAIKICKDANLVCPPDKPNEEMIKV